MKEKQEKRGKQGKSMYTLKQKLNRSESFDKNKNNNKYVRLLLMTIFLASCWLPVRAQYLDYNTNNGYIGLGGPMVSGVAQMQIGLSTASILNGGASIGLLGGADVLLDNPASAARNLRHSFLLQGTGLNDRRTSVLMGYAHVTERGVISGYFSALAGYGHKNRFYPYEIGQMYSFSLAFSKLISTIYEFGFRGTFDYFAPKQHELGWYNREVVSSFGVSVDMAFNVQPRYDFRKFNILSFRNFRYGVSLRNIGWLPRLVGDDKIEAYVKKIDIFRLGAGVDYITIDNSEGKTWFVARFVAEAGLSYPLTGIFSVGFENKFIFNNPVVRSLSLHLGSGSSSYFGSSRYSSYSYFENVFPVVPGISMVFNTKNTEISLRNAYFFEYGYGYYLKLSASLSLEVKFGKLDEKAPEINTDYFSTEGLIGAQ